MGNNLREVATCTSCVWHSFEDNELCWKYGHMCEENHVCDDWVKTEGKQAEAMEKIYDMYFELVKNFGDYNVFAVDNEKIGTVLVGPQMAKSICENDLGQQQFMDGKLVINIHRHKFRVKLGSTLQPVFLLGPRFVRYGEMIGGAKD